MANYKVSYRLCKAFFCKNFDVLRQKTAGRRLAIFESICNIYVLLRVETGLEESKKRIFKED